MEEGLLWIKMDRHLDKRLPTFFALGVDTILQSVNKDIDMSHHFLLGLRTGEGNATSIDG